MGNFDFLKDSSIIVCDPINIYEENTREDLQGFLSDINMRKQLYERFNKADMYAKIDVYSAAIFLRQAWEYLRQGKDYYKFLPKGIEPGKRYCKEYKMNNFIADPGLCRNVHLVRTRRQLTDVLKKHVDISDNDPGYDYENGHSIYRQNFFLTEYIRSLCNSAVHRDGLPQEHFLHSFFEELTFGKVALGMEFTVHILKSYFTRTDPYKYNVNNIPFERYDVLKPIDTGLTEAMLPKRYFICKHSFIETFHRNNAGRDTQELKTYVLIKEFDFCPIDNADTNTEGCYRKFETMLERQEYILQFSPNKQPGMPFSIYNGINNDSPFRHIAYSLPSSQLEIMNNIPRVFLYDHRENNDYLEYNDDFFVKLVRLCKELIDLEEASNGKIKIRGFTKENILICSKSEDWGDNSFYPIFTGYDLCKTSVDPDERSVYTVNYVCDNLIQGDIVAIKGMIERANNNCHAELIASLFVLIFCWYIRDFNINDTSPADLGEKFKNGQRDRNNDENLRNTVTYLQSMIDCLARTEEVLTGTQVDLGDLVNVDTVYNMFSGNFTPGSNEFRGETEQPAPTEPESSEDVLETSYHEPESQTDTALAAESSNTEAAQKSRSKNKSDNKNLFQKIKKFGGFK